MDIGSSSKHPLDQLDPTEIQKAVDIVRREKSLFDKRHRILAVDLLEPRKDYVLSFKSGQKFEREAVLSICIEDEKQLFDAVINLDEEKIISWLLIAEGQSSILSEEFFEVEAAVKKSEEFQSCLKSRGISNPDLVWVEPWTVGNFGLEYEKAGQRLVMAICFLQHDVDDNGYAHPIDGLIPILDINQMKVIHIDNFQPSTPIPQQCWHYETKKVSKTFRLDLKPLLLSQPEGPSFTVLNNEVLWQRWSFRVGFTAREGLILHLVKYMDQGRWRQILYKASLSEMVVPYGDPRPQHFRKNAFDVGDYGIGRCANSLKRGCDCFGEIHYFDGYLNDTKGNVVCIKNAVCVHEEDNGILWKHINWRTGEGETRRSRRLVVSMFATVGNYEYGYYWYFYLDGSIEAEVKLTGVVHVGASFGDEISKYGQIIAPNIFAPIHQHFFSFRLDFTVDGVENSAYEVNLVAEGETEVNPQCNGYYPEYRLLQTDTGSVGQIDARKHRFWKIVNQNVKNSIGQTVGYKLEPHGNAFPFAGPKASVTKRAGFIKNHVWVTEYDPSQLYAAGKYPNQHPGGDGLELWASQNKPIVNKDIVVWYTLGIIHMPRTEDFPVMPVSKASFMLKPDGFFSHNPALDVPPSCKLDRDI